MRIAPEPRPPVSVRPRSARSLRTARYSTIRSFTSSRPVVVLVEDPARLGDVEVVVGPHVPRELESSSRGRSGSSRTRATARTCARGGRARARPARGRPRACRPPRSCCGTLDDVLAAVLAELLADRAHLLAEDELALALLEAVGDVVADLAPSARPRRACPWPSASTISSRSSTSSVSRISTFCSNDEVGRVAGRVGQLPGSVDPAEELGDRGDAAGLDDALDGRRGTRAPARGPGRWLGSSSTGSTWTQVASPVPGTPMPTAARRRPRITRASMPLRRLPMSSILADRADARRSGRPGAARAGAGARRPAAASTAARASADLEREGDDHPGQHDAGGQGQQGKGKGVDLGHVVAPSSWNDRAPARTAGSAPAFPMR